MKNKYDVGDVIPIGFKIKSIEITANSIYYCLESENRFFGNVIRVKFVSESDIDKEIGYEN